MQSMSASTLLSRGRVSVGRQQAIGQASQFGKWTYDAQKRVLFLRHGGLTRFWIQVDDLTTMANVEHRLERVSAQRWATPVIIDDLRRALFELVVSGFHGGVG